MKTLRRLISEFIEDVIRRDELDNGDFFTILIAEAEARGYVLFSAETSSERKNVFCKKENVKEINIEDIL